MFTITIGINVNIRTPLQIGNNEADPTQNCAIRSRMNALSKIIVSNNLNVETEFMRDKDVSLF